MLLLVSSDSLYFNSLHLSTPSLRVVSHQQLCPSLCPIQYHTLLLTIKAYFQAKPSKLLACLLLLPSFCTLFLSFLSAVHPLLKSVENAGACPVTVVPISQTKLTDPVWYCQMAWKIKNPIKVAVQRSALLHIKSSPLAILHKLYPLTAHFAQPAPAEWLGSNKCFPISLFNFKSKPPAGGNRDE